MRAVRRVGRLTPFIFFAVASCSDPLGVYSLDVFTSGYTPPRGGSSAPVAFVVDQVVTFIARESHDESWDCDCVEYTTSDKYPGHFVWESDNPAVAKVISPGKVQMVALGQARLRVSTENESRTMMVHVVPPISSVSVGSKAVDMATNAISWIRVIARDGLGDRIAGVGVNEGTVILTPEDKTENFVNPVASYTASAGDSIAVYGLRSGTIRFIASLPVFGAHTLRDTVTITVK